MEPSRRAFAEAARGFMPPDEGLALHQAACDLGVDGPLLEVGSYCGKSSVYLGDAAQAQGRVLFALDHHRGSEENQPGWEWHEPDLVDPDVGLIDTLPHFRRTIHQAGLEGSVVALVGDSVAIAQNWSTPLAFLFIDGGHGTEPAHADYENWVPHVAIGGCLAIHDVFPDPADGGRPPYEVYCRAMESGAFSELSVTGSLRVLTRRALGI
ncbi:MAG: class I SAM-dependent methyltransferase [Acidimicrobiia bacterium]|nr:class I SAM-dependent methyltransferase [Acidimicrobiia bacterium]MYE74071.1 class I SAM-dependent methyltransferase [Acidimicrobiia bacterium]MYJ63368.1 class I SAM-dependent methyltransferase [Acidimicrobiia bacterium]